MVWVARARPKTPSQYFRAAEINLVSFVSTPSAIEVSASAKSMLQKPLASISEIGSVVGSVKTRKAVPMLHTLPKPSLACYADCPAHPTDPTGNQLQVNQ